MYIHVPTQPPAPSKNARELATKLAELVRILRREDSSISRGDVQQGMQLAQAELRRELGGSNHAPLIAALLAAFGLSLGVAAPFAFNIQSARPSMMILIIALVAVPVVVALFILWRKRR